MLRLHTERRRSFRPYEFTKGDFPSYLWMRLVRDVWLIFVSECESCALAVSYVSYPRLILVISRPPPHPQHHSPFDSKVEIYPPSPRICLDETLLLFPDGRFF